MKKAKYDRLRRAIRNEMRAAVHELLKPNALPRPDGEWFSEDGSRETFQGPEVDRECNEAWAQFDETFPEVK